MTPSRQCIDLVKRFEGVSLTPYLCPAGKWTIGYGHTDGVSSISEPITQEAAERLLAADLMEIAVAVSSVLQVSVTQSQFDALVSFTYNLGVGALRRSSLLRMLNMGHVVAASHEFEGWVYGGGKVLPGLQRRRADERALFDEVRA